MHYANTPLNSRNTLPDPGLVVISIIVGLLLDEILSVPGNVLFFLSVKLPAVNVTACVKLSPDLNSNLNFANPFGGIFVILNTNARGV